MLEGQKRSSLLELRELLVKEPLVLRSSSKQIWRLALISCLALSFYGGVLVLGTVKSFFFADWPSAIVATTLILVIALTPFIVWIVRSKSGYELIADKNGLRTSRFGRLLWSVPWSKLVIKASGLGEGLLLLPDGRKIKLRSFPTDVGDERRDLKRILQPHLVRTPITWQRGVVELVVSLAAMTGGAVAGRWGNLGIERYFEAESQLTSLDASLYLFALVVGALLAFGGAFWVLLSFRWLENFVKKSRASAHGPTFEEFTTVFGKDVRPIQMDDGVRYRYLDPKSLRAQRNNAWPLFGVLAFVALLVLAGVLFIPRRHPSDDVWVGWLTFACLAASTPLPLLMLRKECVHKSSLLDTFWVEGDRLYVQRGPEVHSFPIASAKPPKPKSGHGAEYFMAQFETFTDGESSYSLDRRFLWPLEPKS